MKISFAVSYNISMRKDFSIWNDSFDNFRFAYKRLWGHLCKIFQLRWRKWRNSHNSTFSNIRSSAKCYSFIQWTTLFGNYYNKNADFMQNNFFWYSYKEIRWWSQLRERITGDNLQFSKWNPTEIQNSSAGYQTITNHIRNSLQWTNYMLWSKKY